MKVWISLCLIWLAVRVVSAQEPISREHGPYDFSRIDLALEYVERVSTNNDEEEHVKVLSLIDKFSSLEELMRGSLIISFRPQGALKWSLPAPEVNLSNKDRLVFQALATRYLYPEVRLVEALSVAIDNRVQEIGFLIGRQERKAAQKLCLEQKTMTEDCVLTEALKDVAKELSETVANEHDSQLPAEQLAQALKQLIEKSQSQSAFYREAFYGDTAKLFFDRVSAKSLVKVCLDYPQNFFAWELIGKKRCGKAIESHLKKGVPFKVDAAVGELIVKELSNPFSEFQMMMVSLSEEVLNRGVFCYKSSCVERKLIERLNEWSFGSRFNGLEKTQMAVTLSKYWLE